MLELNHTYLIRFGGGDTLNSVTVLLITDKAYHFRWNHGLESTDSWELKTKIDRYYTIVEDISDFMVETKIENILQVKTKLVQCHVCKGFGTIPDNNSTGGSKSCPLCYGSKMIPEVTEIS
jgi:hypothetical protein